MFGPRCVLVLLSALVLATTAACSDEPADRDAAGSYVFEHYVAMGDSSVAGPGIPVRDRKAGLCARSIKNYPSVLSNRIDIRETVDVSCSAATSDEVRSFGQDKAGVAFAQIEAIKEQTDLVTLSIGGNDGTYMALLWNSCVYGDDLARTCAEFVDTSVEKFVDAIGDNVTKTLQEIKERAPKATVVLVGYMRAAPDKGTCADLRTPASVVGKFRRAEKLLAEEFREAARRADVLFVPMYELSKGHDVCSKDPWTNGAVSTGDGTWMHPRSKGMAKIAEALADLLERETGRGSDGSADEG